MPTDEPACDPSNVDGRVRVLDELPPRESGIWGGETVYVGGVKYGRCHGGPWFEESRTCDFWWGDWRCTREAHGDDQHSLEFIDCDGDVTVDPRLT